MGSSNGNSDGRAILFKYLWKFHHQKIATETALMQRRLAEQAPVFPIVAFI